MKKETAKEFASLTFEQALQKLEAVVGKMEEGNLPLDEMINYFEQGGALSAICTAKLKELEKKIEILVSENAEGGKWKDFDPEEPQESQPAKKQKPPPKEDEKEKEEEDEDTLF